MCMRVCVSELHFSLTGHVTDHVCHVLLDIVTDHVYHIRLDNTVDIETGPCH